MQKTLLITVTGDRPEAFRLAEFYMATQTSKYWDWLVVDDGAEPTEITQEQYYIRHCPGRSPLDSFRVNMAAALKWGQAMGYQKFIIIEDDDWYSSQYVEKCINELEHFHLYGQCGARYYNVKYRLYKQLNHTSHASMCSTAFTLDAVPTVLDVLERQESHHDMRLWRLHGTELGGLSWQAKLEPTVDVVGIKGMPGRVGIGMGHRMEKELVYSGFAYDPDMSKLQEWVGSDYMLYSPFVEV